jgi:hypothetical protein
MPMPADGLASMAIAGVLLLAVAVVNPVAPALLPGFVVLALLALRGDWPVRRGLALAWRLKWFFLSLLVFFGWLHPDSGSVGWERLLPSAGGLGDAAVRIAALVLVVCWVAWLTAVFDRGAQVRGLARWLALLRPLGLRGEVFARRMFLALDYFEAQRSEYLALRQRTHGSRWGRLKAGREFLITGLDHGLSGSAPPGYTVPAGAATTGAARAARGSLSWQVALLWLAAVAAGGIRMAGPWGGA